MTAKAKDAIRLCQNRNCPCFVGFLNEHQVSMVLAFAKKQQFFNYKLWGGYPESDRVFFGAFPTGDQIRESAFPVSVISFTYKPQYKLTHRDFLGVLMGLGIKREAVGDIVTGSGKTYVFVKEEVEKFILSQISKVGNVGVVVCKDTANNLKPTENFLETAYTVASLRLDNVVSAAWNLSRDKSAAAVKSGMVAVNSVAVTNISATVKQGDKIAYKGFGKIIVSELGGITKKGREKLIVKKYR